MDFTVLVVDDEQEMCLSLSELLSANGIRTLAATNPLEVGQIVGSRRIDLIIMDIKMPRMGGIDLLRLVKRRDPGVSVIMMTGYPSVENAVMAMRLGAIDFLVKPLNSRALIETIRRLAKSKGRGQAEGQPVRIVTKSRILEAVVAEIRKVAPTRAPVLITGESGTGKELAAELIHSLSPVREQRLIKVNCAAIPDTLLESELFGHEKGAFTGATNLLTGKFELASQGTLFLDEIGDMSLATQAKILRVLQDGEIQRLGSERTIRVSPRVVAASNKNLSEAMQRGDFRKDLYFRLSVVAIHLPALRERKEDVLTLAEHFREQFNATYGKDVRRISDEVRRVLLEHDWPGNVRELKNAIERAVIFAEGQDMLLGDLPSQYRQTEGASLSTRVHDVVELLSRQQIEEALRHCQGVKHKAAEMLNIHRKTLYNRMKSLGME